jgi:hypothetical protein
MNAIEVTVVYNGERFDARCNIMSEPGDKIKMTITNVTVKPFFMSIKVAADELMNAIDAAMEENNQEKEN